MEEKSDVEADLPPSSQQDRKTYQKIAEDADDYIDENALYEEKENRDPSARNPLDSAGFFSQLFLAWLTPLITLGAKKPLEAEDVYCLPHAHLSSVVHEHVSHFWRMEREKHPERPLLYRALFNAYRGQFIGSAFYFLIFITITMIQPSFVSALLDYVNTGEVNLWGMRSGYTVALVLGGVSIFSVFCFSSAFLYGTRLGMYIRSGLIALLFEKSLNISNSAKNKHTSGEILTLMSVDVERQWQGIIIAQWIWMAPAMIIVAMVLLVYQIGNAAFACVGVLVLWTWLQDQVGRWIGQTRSILVKFTAERTKLTNEMLQGVRVIKLYAWEVPAQQRINDVREKEVLLVRKYHLLKMINSVILFVGPVLVAFCLFITYTSIGKQITVTKVYTSLAILNIIRLPIALLPMAKSAASEAYSSMKRLNAFMLHEEMTPLPTIEGEGSETVLGDNDISESSPAIALTNTKTTSDATDNKLLIDIQNASFVWNEVPNGAAIHEKDVILREISLQIRRGEFVAVVGSVGSGKSSLVSAMLGQMTRLDGSQRLSGKVAYVSQDHWIQNITLQDNVLFNTTLDDDRYADVMDASQLSRDLLTLPNADYTEIGERGITLSGGQKARVNIARALYAKQRDLYIFDDPLAAVDVHVGKAIFEQAMCDLLHDKARIVVLSSNYHLLPHFDKIIVVADNTIDVCDSYERLKEIYPQYSSVDGENAFEEKKNADRMSPQTLTPVKSMFRNFSTDIGSRQKSGKVLTTAEDREKGEVTLATYVKYFASAVDGNGALTLAFFLLLFSIGQGFRVVFDIWVGIWAEDLTSNHPTHTNKFYSDLYIIFVAGVCVFAFVRAYLFVTTCVKASSKMHKSLLFNVIAAPINLYFDITPLGRILNRFSKDLDSMDSLLPDFFLQNIQNSFHVLSIVVVCIISVPFIAILLLPLGAIFFLLQSFYRKTSRELKRLEGVTRSPVYSLFSEMLQGLPTIRAYGRQKQFMHRHHQRANSNMVHFFAFWMSSRWLAIRLDLVGNLIVLAVGLIAVIMTDEGVGVNPNLLGLSLVYSLQLTGLLQWTVRVAIETENNMTAVERLLAFSKIPSEAAATTSNDPVNWPSEGNIVLRDVSLRYRPGLSCVLKNVNLTVEGGHKVGVCGRTGAGKSSLMLALFRIVEPEDGSSIVIDGVDIMKIGLECLRTHLTIIPQDPVMFSGTLRYNLDPFDKYTDAEVWEALERAHLKEDIISKFPDKLKHHVSERGENISVGQRQLLCIARALLRKSKVIVMDEATASVDSVTDQKIQMTIREAFDHCTVLTIAHRLETIADYDKIVVMDHGSVAEVGSPYDLLQQEGYFKGLIDELGAEKRAAFLDITRKRAGKNSSKQV